jgi:hypothetical protein
MHPLRPIAKARSARGLYIYDDEVDAWFCHHGAIRFGLDGRHKVRRAEHTMSVRFATAVAQSRGGTADTDPASVERQRQATHISCDG